MYTDPFCIEEVRCQRGEGACAGRRIKGAPSHPIRCFEAVQIGLVVVLYAGL